MDYSIKICGEAGQGVQTIGSTLARLFSREGYHVFTHQDYESRVRGGHNFYQVRLSSGPVMSSRRHIDILVALDREGITQYSGELTDKGRILCDPALKDNSREDPRFVDIPFADLAQQHGGSHLMANAVAVGAVLGMLSVRIDLLEQIFQDSFSKKGEDIVMANFNAAQAGYDYAVSRAEACTFTLSPGSGTKMLISGNDAIGLGAVASGVKFYAAYPMTPSTGIMNFIASREEEYGIVVEQAEDEIAAINMILGASFAGVRSMTGTSGGGFALMVEGLSLAGMTETPCVIALAQRPGPATGLPTRTEQADLQFALYSAHGEFPRVIFAPGTPEEAFFLTNRAFGIAEKYQVPVIIMTDQYLADSQWTYDSFDLKKLHYSDNRLRQDSLRNITGYKRHAYTDNGVTPMAVPGASEHLVVTDSDEHDEEGHIIEDSETRINMMGKRLFRKMPHIREDIAAPSYTGVDGPDIVIVGWGSTSGVIRDAAGVLSASHSIGALHFSEIYPLPETEKFDYISLLEDCDFAICIENNATGQFARLMRSETGYEFRYRINKYDGRPFMLEDLTREINAIIKGN